MAGEDIRKDICDGECDACTLNWQQQCAARFGFRNMQNYKSLLQKVEILEAQNTQILTLLSSISNSLTNE